MPVVEWERGVKVVYLDPEIAPEDAPLARGAPRHLAAVGLVRVGGGGELPAPNLTDVGCDGGDRCLTEIGKTLGEFWLMAAAEPQKIGRDEDLPVTLRPGADPDR